MRPSIEAERNAACSFPSEGEGANYTSPILRFSRHPGALLTFEKALIFK